MDGIFSESLGSRRVTQSAVDLVRHVGVKCYGEMHHSEQGVIRFPGADETLSVDRLRQGKQDRNKKGASPHDRHNLLSEGFPLQQFR